MAELACDVLVVGAGNGRFTEGSMRFAFGNADELMKLVPDLTGDE